MNIQNSGIIITGMQHQQQQQLSILQSSEPVLSTTNSKMALADSREKSTMAIEEMLDSKGDVGARGFCRRDIDEKLTSQQSKEATQSMVGTSDYVKEDDITQFDVVFVGRGGNQSIMENEIYRGYVWYRCILGKLKPVFHAISSKSGKIKLSRWVVKKIKAFGGRFLIKDKEGNRYDE
jgi:hypothetical protein